MEELDEQFQALIAQLVDEGVVEQGPDAPVIVSSEQESLFVVYYQQDGFAVMNL